MERTLHFVEPRTLEHTLKLIQEAGYFPKIRLAAHGEPLLHPGIVGIVRTIREKLPKSQLHLFTNGTVIEKDHEIVERLFAAGLNNLIIDEYEDHRIGDFVRKDPVCRKFKQIEFYKGCGVHLLDVKLNERRICIVQPITKGKGTSKLCNHLGAGLPPLQEPMRKRCSVIFRELTIRWNGEVAICCNDFRGLYRVGSVLECESLRELWFHPRFESARKFLYYGDRTFYPCNLCDASPNRAGLLPDPAGKLKMPEPTEKDLAIVSKRFPPLAVIVRRAWE